MCREHGGESRESGNRIQEPDNSIVRLNGRPSQNNGEGRYKDFEQWSNSSGNQAQGVFSIAGASRSASDYIESISGKSFYRFYYTINPC